SNSGVPTWRGRPSGDLPTPPGPAVAPPPPATTPPGLHAFFAAAVGVSGSVGDTAPAEARRAALQRVVQRRPEASETSAAPAPACRTSPPGARRAATAGIAADGRSPGTVHYADDRRNSETPSALRHR